MNDFEKEISSVEENSGNVNANDIAECAEECDELTEVSESMDEDSTGDNAQADDAVADGNDSEAKKPFAEAYDWVSSLVYAVLFMLVLNLFVFRSITVDGDSMINTLQDQDKVIATNFFYTPDYGDIVVLQADRLYNYYSNMFGEPIIKRVIGLEGDVIRFNFEEGEVYRNGELLDEDYIAELTTVTRPGYCQSGVDYVVPENCVFVMGDNRNASRDSRDLTYVGYVDTDLIMGKAIVRIYPFDSIKLL